MFYHDFIHIKPNLCDFNIADSAINVRPAININRLLKKKFMFSHSCTKLYNFHKQFINDIQIYLKTLAQSIRRVI